MEPGEVSIDASTVVEKLGQKLGQKEVEIASLETLVNQQRETIKAQASRLADAERETHDASGTD